VWRHYKPKTKKKPNACRECAGASGLPYYCTLPVCIPAVLGASHALPFFLKNKSRKPFPKKFTTHGFTLLFPTLSHTQQPSKHTGTTCHMPCNPISLVLTLSPFTRASDTNKRTFHFSVVWLTQHCHHPIPQQLHTRKG